MRSAPASLDSSSTARVPRDVLIAVTLLLLAIGASYSNTFHAPFVFDDEASIAANASIRDLANFRQLISPPTASGTTVGGRPLLNISFAVNRAVSGEAVWSYHVTNLAIHLGCALLLFGIIRRTLDRLRNGASLADAKQSLGSSVAIATVAALWWAVHPIQTESVTYLAQRAESLASFFILLTLFAFIRAQESRVPRRWLTLSIVACILGVATKEISATAPILVLLYDAVFVAGSLPQAWRARSRYYAPLAASWLLLAALVSVANGRDGTAGFGSGISPWRYAFTQGEAIIRYLALAVWPFPQVFDYGGPLATATVGSWLAAIFILALLLGAIVTFGRWPKIGFLGLGFFLLLAPSSSFLPIATQTIAEHRMYLPLAVIAVSIATGAARWFGRAGLAVVVAVAAGDAFATWRRNEVYRSEVALWSNTAEGAPKNPRAHNNLGNALLAANQTSAAIDAYRTALALRPDYADAENNLGHALLQHGAAAEALTHLEAAVRARPNSVPTLINLGSALTQTGRAPDAIAVYEHALAIDPNSAKAWYNLANAEFKLGDFQAAAQAYRRVLEIDRGNSDARFNLAATMLKLSRPSDAVTEYQQLLALTPNDAMVHAELANVLAHTGHRDEAINHFETAIRLQPDFAVARRELDRLRAETAGAAK